MAAGSDRVLRLRGLGPALAVAVPVVVLLAAVVPVGVGAQRPPPPPPSLNVSTFVTEREQELKLAAVEERLADTTELTMGDGATDPVVDLRALVEAAHWATELAYTRGATDAGRDMARRAFGYAEQAAAIDPADVDARYWMAASAGLLADAEGGRTKIRWANRAWQESGAVLALDSAHAGAHHIQGRLHAAVMRLNRVLRFLARSLLGGDALKGASWEAAERHLTLAAELDPREPGHHLELAMLYLDRDRPAEARQALLVTRSTTPRREPDRRARATAEELLAEVGC